MGAEVLHAAWLLQARPYGDTSQLLELFTRERGRVGAIARGSRAPRSRLRSVLQPFAPLWVGFSGRGELQTLTVAESAGAALSLQGEQVFYGWYVQELLLKLTLRDDPHPELHDLLAPTLQALGSPLYETALRQFEYRLLESLGFGLPPLPDELMDAGLPLDWWPESDWQLAAGAGGVQPASLEALLSGEPLSSTAARELRPLLARGIAHALGGRPLETPRLLRAMRARAAR